MQLVRLLIAGFGALVLGLNLMMIHYITSITSKFPIEIINKLTETGSIITGIGFTILIIALIRGFRGNLSEETSVVLSTGTYVTVMGISTIISGRGHGNETIVYVGSWVSTGAGIILIVTYLFLQYLQPFIARIRGT